MLRYPAPLAQLISKLGQLPSIGGKSAQRLAFHLTSIDKKEALALAEAIVEAREKLHPCHSCYTLTDQDYCSICSDSSRDKSLLCVVEYASDIHSLERSRSFHGYYHVLGGVLSPSQKISPEHLRIRELLDRLRSNLEIQEVILANSFTVEGESTANYLFSLLKNSGIKVTRLAHGLPTGSNMDFIDEVTLSKALKGRTSLGD